VCRSTRSRGVPGSSRCPSLPGDVAVVGRDGFGPDSRCSTSRARSGERASEPRRLRTPRASSAGGANRYSRASGTLCRAADRRTVGLTPSPSAARELHLPRRLPSPVFRQAPGLPPRQGRLRRRRFRANDAAAPRAPLVESWSGLSTVPGLRAFPSQFPRASLRTLVADRVAQAGVLRRGSPLRWSPDRRTPRGARRSRWTRCVSPTCATIDLPHEHPSRTVRFPLPWAGEDGALDGAPPASADLSRSPALLPSHRVGLRRAGLFQGRVARRSYRRLLREAASNAPRARRIGPLRGRTRLPLTPRVVLAPGGEPLRGPILPCGRTGPEHQDRLRCPPVKEARCLGPGCLPPAALARSPASAIESDSRARSRIVRTRFREAPRLPSRLAERRRSLFRSVAGRISRPRGVGRGLRHRPPPTRRTWWDYPKTELSEHPCRPFRGVAGRRSHPRRALLTQRPST
jgi:hypothetical protein